MNIGFLMTDGYDAREFAGPYDELQRRGVPGVVIGPVAGAEITDKLGRASVHADWSAAQALTANLTGLVIPGGHSPDRLRILPEAVTLVADLHRSGCMIAAICHGPWLLIEAGVVTGKRVTSWRSVRTDLLNAGAHWVDEAVVEDGNLITSRCPDDIPAFTAAIATAIGERAGAA